MNERLVEAVVWNLSSSQYWRDHSDALRRIKAAYIGDLPEWISPEVLQSLITLGSYLDARIEVLEGLLESTYSEDIGNQFGMKSAEVDRLISESIELNHNAKLDKKRFLQLGKFDTEAEFFKALLAGRKSLELYTIDQLTGEKLLMYDPDIILRNIF